MTLVLQNHRVAAGCNCGDANDTQPWETSINTAGAIGPNSAVLRNNAKNTTIQEDAQFQAHAADLLQFALGQPVADPRLLQLGMLGLAHGLELAGSGMFEDTVQPERGASYFAEGLARSALLLSAAGKNDEVHQLADPNTLDGIAKWLGSSSSMRRQGGLPEVRFARAAALHMLAPLLSKPAGQQAVLSAHRYARRGVEMQEPNGTYCYIPTGPETANMPSMCQFSMIHHSRALIFTARLLAVCGWGDLRSLLRASLELALNRLLVAVDNMPATETMQLRSEEGELTRTVGEALLIAGSEVDRPQAIQTGTQLLQALVWEN